MVRKSFAILGTGQFGNQLARNLTEHGQDVLVVDEDRCRVQPIEDIVNRTVIGNIADEAVLSEIGVRNFDVVIVASSHDVERSLMAATLCLEMGCTYIIAKANSPIHARMLRKLGVQKVIMPDLDMAGRLSRSLLARSLFDLIAITDEFSIIEWMVPQSFVGKTLADLRLREKYSVNVALIKSRGTVNVPKGHCVLQPNDVLLILGRDEDLARMEQVANGDCNQ